MTKGEIRFSLKDGRTAIFDIRAQSDTINRSILQRLRDRGIHLGDNSPALEKVEFADEMLKAITLKVRLIDAGAEVPRDATTREVKTLLESTMIGTEILKASKQLRIEEEGVLEVVSGNSEASSGSSSG